MTEPETLSDWNLLALDNIIIINVGQEIGFRSEKGPPLVL